MLFFEAILSATGIALLSIIGVLLFGHDKRLLGVERYIVPVAVGAFLGLVLFELIPETIMEAPQLGSVVIFIGFLAFYILASKLHERYHHLEDEHCDRKGAAALVLIGDAIHNFSDGIVLGGAFLISPAVGAVTALGLAFHEIPQEIVEFGVLVRSGYTRWQAATRNLFSASTIILGTAVVVGLSAQLSEYVWVLTGLAAGNLLFLAVGELLPRIHGNLPHYGNIWQSATAILIGFLIMASLVLWSHEHFDHGHEHVLEDSRDHGYEL